MSNLLIARKISSIEIHPVKTAKFNIDTTSMDVAWDSPMKLPSIRSKVVWAGLKSKPSQSRGYSGAVPISDSEGLQGVLTFDVAYTYIKAAEVNQDLKAINDMVAYSSKDLNSDYPYFKVVCTVDNGEKYTLLCGMSVSFKGGISKKWDVELKPNKVLDTDLGDESVEFEIVRPSLADINHTSVRLDWQTTYLASFVVEYSHIEAHVLWDRSIRGGSLQYTHSIVLDLPPTSSTVYFKITAIRETEGGSVLRVSTPHLSYKKGIQTIPLNIVALNFVPSDIAGQGTVTWATNRPSSTIVRYGIDQDITQSVVGVINESKSEVITYSTVSNVLFIQVTSVDDQGYTDTSEIRKFTVFPERPPIVSQPEVLSKTDTSITIECRTDVPCTVIYDWGLSDVTLDNSTANPGIGALKHRVTVFGLDIYTSYYFRAEATTVGASAQRSYSSLLNSRTLEGLVPKVTDFVVSNGVPASAKIITFQTDVPCIPLLAHGTDTTEMVVEPQESTATATAHVINFDFEQYPVGTVVFVQARGRSVQGIVGSSELLNFGRTSNADPTIKHLTIIELTISTVTFKIDLEDGSAPAYAKISGSPDMSGSISSNLSPSATTHTVSIPLATFKDGEKVYYTAVVQPVSAPTYETLPREFDTIDNSHPVFTSVVAVKSVGDDYVVRVTADASIPVIAEVRWGTHELNLDSRVLGITSNESSIDISINIDREQETGTLFIVVAGHTARGRFGVSSVIEYAFVKEVDELSIVNLSLEQGVDLNSKVLTWDTTKPTTSVVRYGVDAGIDLVTPGGAAVVTTHSVIIDISTVQSGGIFYYKPEGRTSEGRLVVFPELLVGHKGDSNTTITSMLAYAQTSNSFRVKFSTSTSIRYVLIYWDWATPGITNSLPLTPSTAINHNASVTSIALPTDTKVGYRIVFYDAGAVEIGTSATYATYIEPTEYPVIISESNVVNDNTLDYTVLPNVESNVSLTVGSTSNTIGTPVNFGVPITASSIFRIVLSSSQQFSGQINFKGVLEKSVDGNSVPAGTLGYGEQTQEFLAGAVNPNFFNKISNVTLMNPRRTTFEYSITQAGETKGYFVHGTSPAIQSNITHTPVNGGTGTRFTTIDLTIYNEADTVYFKYVSFHDLVGFVLTAHIGDPI